MAPNWESVAVLAHDYTVFLHLEHPTDRAVAVGDGPPRAGHYPTSLWQPGAIVEDRHYLVALPDDYPTELRLRVGLYDLATGQRLPARDAQGQVWPDGAVDLGGWGP